MASSNQNTSSGSIISAPLGWVIRWSNTLEPNTDIDDSPYNSVLAPVCANGYVYYSLNNTISALDFETGTSVWSCNLAAPASTPIVVYGSSILVGATSSMDSTSTIYCLDGATGVEQWKFLVPASSSGYSPQMYPFTLFGSAIIFGTDTNILYQIDAGNNGTLVWSVTLPPSGQANSIVVLPPAVNNGTVYVANQSNQPGSPLSWSYLTAVDLGTGTIQNSLNIDSIFENQLVSKYNIGSFNNEDVDYWGFSTSLHVSPAYGYVCFGYNNLLTLGVDPSVTTYWSGMNLTPLADINVTNLDLSAGAYTGDLLYVFQQQSNGQVALGALYPASGNVAIPYAIPSQTANPEVGDDTTIFLNNNTIYMPSGGYFWSIPYDLDPSNVQVIDPGSDYFIYLASGALDGINYARIVTGQMPNPTISIEALQLENINNLFLVDTKFMEDWTTSGGRTYSYQILVKVLDQNGYPLPYETVKIWSQPTYTGDPLQVEIAGVSYSLQATGTDDATNYVTAATNSFGDILIAIYSSMLTVPPIKLWAAFMMPGESIAIQPQQAISGIAQIAVGTNSEKNNVVGTQLLAATNYSGQPVLTSKYQNSTSADAIGYCIQNFLQSQSQSQTAEAVAWTPPKYISNLQTYQNIFFLEPDALLASPDATMNTTNLNNYSFSVDDTGAVGSSSGSSQTAASAVVPGILHDLKDLGHDMISGAESAWDSFESDFSYVEGKIQAVIKVTINQVETTYQDTVETLDDVGTVVLAVFKSIGAEFDDICEWIVTLLKNIFDWKQILAVQGYIKNSVNQSLDAASNGFSYIADKVLEPVQEGFQDAASTFNSNYGNYFKEYFGPSVTFGSQIQSSYNSALSSISNLNTNWLLHQVLNDIGKIDSDDLSFDNTLKAFSSFQSSISTMINNSGSENVQEVQSALLNAFSNPQNLLDSSVDGLFGQISSVLSLILNNTPQALGDGLNLVQVLFTELDDFLQSSLNIPVISQILEVVNDLFGTDVKLQVLDTICLIVAFPTNAIYSLSNDGATLSSSDFPTISFDSSQLPSQAAEDAAVPAGLPAGITSLSAQTSNSQAGLTMAYAAAGLCFTVMDATNDGTDGGMTVGGLTALYVGTELVTTALGIGARLAGPQGTQVDTICGWINYSVKFVGMAITIAGAAQGTPSEGESTEGESKVLAAINCGYGLVELVIDMVPPIVDSVNGKYTPSSSQVASSVLNCTSCLTDIMKPLGLTSVGTVALVVIDVTFGGSYYFAQIYLD